MDESQFWIRLWKIIGLVLCVLIVSVSSCTANRQYQTRVLIENAKVNPIDAKCAIEGENLQSAPCIIRALEKQHEPS